MGLCPKTKSDHLSPEFLSLLWKPKYAQFILQHLKPLIHFKCESCVCVDPSQIKYLPASCTVALISTACCSQIRCDSRDSLFLSYSTSIHYSFLGQYFFPSSQRKLPVPQKYLRFTGSMTHSITGGKWMSGGWLPSHLSLFLFVPWRMMPIGGERGGKQPPASTAPMTDHCLTASGQTPIILFSQFYNTSLT